ncbi:hypothetical protein VB713_14235 [Anabaena cylindrica UHCC 0172]|uniref:hypothetical protein n=1 Tax=Anabaena cylindrica TaxID=1165 RepID=UPI002B20DCF5|nr:hypothetical protein [Anabaena cylindrica]MEA5552103.1 hypothetical protein [Anabaena cylindrica UHCC 0172]
MKTDTLYERSLLAYKFLEAIAPTQNQSITILSAPIIFYRAIERSPQPSLS